MECCKFKEIGCCKEIIFDKTGLPRKKFQWERIKGISDSLEIGTMAEYVSNRITLVKEEDCIEYIGMKLK